MNLKEKTIAFLGDSITEGVGASAYDKIFHQLLMKNYGLNQAINYGIGGTTIARQTHLMDPNLSEKHFCNRVDAMCDYADAVVVFGGTNDYGHGDAPIGCFTDRTDETFYGACHVLMRALREKYISKPIIFMTPLHRENEECSISNEIYKNCTLKNYVDVIKMVAEYYSIPILDLYAKSGMQPNISSNNAYYFTDGLHPNDNGHARIAAMLGKYLESLEYDL